MEGYIFIKDRIIAKEDIPHEYLYTQDIAKAIINIAFDRITREYPYIRTINYTESKPNGIIGGIYSFFIWVNDLFPIGVIPHTNYMKKTDHCESLRIKIDMDTFIENDIEEIQEIINVTYCKLVDYLSPTKWLFTDEKFDDESAFNIALRMIFDKPDKSIIPAPESVPISQVVPNDNISEIDIDDKEFFAQFLIHEFGGDNIEYINKKITTFGITDELIADQFDASHSRLRLIRLFVEEIKKRDDYIRNSLLSTKKMIINSINHTISTEIENKEFTKKLVSKLEKELDSANDENEKLKKELDLKNIQLERLISHGFSFGLDQEKETKRPFGTSPPPATRG